MKQIEHPNIIVMMDFFEDTKYLIMVEKLMSFDMRSLLVELKTALVEKQIKNIFY